MLVKFGNFLFHYRNILFPFFYAALFLPSPDIFTNHKTAFIPGAFFIGAGIIIRSITIGLVYIIRGGKKKQIYAENLVTEGIYKICRNPMYLGNILLIFGFGIFANSLLFLILFFPLFLFFYLSIIKAEESFLFTKFGSRFEDYKNSTNALVPDLSSAKEAFAGHRFNFRRVIRKEYNSYFIYLSGILLLIWYKNLFSRDLALLIFSLLLIVYLFLKWLKKTKKL